MIPKYYKEDRHAIQQLSSASLALFGVIEREEKAGILDVEGLCDAISRGPTFVAFSCLSGNGKREEFGMDLGSLFFTRLKEKVERFTTLLREAGYTGSFYVIVDDTEPSRVWQWRIAEQDATLWYHMVIEDTKLPLGWEVCLWSDIERAFRTSFPSMGYSRGWVSSFDEYLKERRAGGPSHNEYRILQHMKKYPNKKLREEVPLEEVVLRRVVQYKWQSRVLSQFIPNPVLIQTETPRTIKDPLLYNPLGNSFRSIIHPFGEERR